MADTLADNMISVAIAIDNKGHRAQCITPTFPFFTVVSFDEPSTIYQRWLIERHGDQAAYTIRNADNKFYTCAREGKVQGTPDFDQSTCLWYIQRAGDDKYKILVPNQDCVWTVEGSGVSRNVFLKGADGSDAQLFTFRFA